MKKIFLIFCLFLSMETQAKTTIEVKPNPVTQGNAVELILSSDTTFDAVPNISALQKDFVIGGQQRRQSAQWINGKGSTLYQLIYTLFPNKTGIIPIQGLRVGSDVLPSVSLTVNTTDNKSSQSQNQLSLSVQCPKTVIYPAQRILCTVDLDDPVGITEGQIIPPQTDVGTWEQIMAPVPVATTSKGNRHYQAAFAFTPKQSGHLEISPFVFQGQARFNTRGKVRYDSILDFMAMAIQPTATQPVGAQSASFVIPVKEKPADYHGWWLPSTDVTLTEQYQSPEHINVGDPVTRTLTLTAKDVLADDMPVPEAIATSDLKVYANPAQRQDTPQGGQVVVTLTFVPTKNGDVTIPAIQIPWFDLNHEKVRYASVPEQKIFVNGSATTTASVSEQPALDTSPAPQSVPVIPTSEVPSHVVVPWLWIGLAIAVSFILGVLLTFFLLRKKTHQERQKKKPLPDLYPF